MNERLLQFLWQFQYFNSNELSTACGEPVQVIHPGRHNLNQGPDFIDAKVRIGTTTWAGNVELHVKSTDWLRHGHDGDQNYGNVILHVVWDDDALVNSINNIPTLQLKERVAGILLSRYERLMQSPSFLPCEGSVSLIKEITWNTWKDRLLAERMSRRADTIITLLQTTKFHWEETFWWMLARSFGMKVNADAFEALARSIPLQVLARHKHQLHQLEALLFGQANLLQNRFTEHYPRMLQKEYRYLRKKLGLKPNALPLHFLRMRPGNFPTVRLAQLAKLIYDSAHLFSRVRDATSLQEVTTAFDVTASNYWDNHYRFGEVSELKKKRPGQAMVDTIIVNTVAPVLFAYGRFHQDEKLKMKALQWLEETKAEKNAITHGFELLGVKNENAFDSQAIIELKNEYCNMKRCLECAVGYSILRMS